MKKQTKNTKTLLFENMVKINPDFKPKLNESMDEISTGLAQKAATAAGEKYFNTDRNTEPLMTHKLDVQNAKFGEYINPELKNFLMKTFVDVPGFNVSKKANETTLNFPVNPNQEGVSSVNIIISPDAYRVVSLKPVMNSSSRFNQVEGGNQYLPQQHLSKLPNIIKRIQADMKGSKSIFNPEQPIENEGVNFPSLADTDNPEIYQNKVNKLKAKMDDLFNNEEFDSIDGLYKLLVDRNNGQAIGGAINEETLKKIEKVIK